MTIEPLTAVLAVILLLMALITPLMNPFFRRPRREDADAGATEQSPVTVLLVSNGDHTALDEHLPI